MIEKKDPGVTPAVWQEQDGWHVRVRHAGEVRVFATRDEAISYSTSTFTDGPTAARAETQRGEVTQTRAQTAKKPLTKTVAKTVVKTVAKTAPSPTQVAKRPPDSASESGL